MFDLAYVDAVSVVIKKYSVVPDAKSKFWRVDALELFDVAFAGVKKSTQSAQYTQRRRLID